MDCLRILIACNDAQLSTDLSSLLRQTGHTLVSGARSGMSTVDDMLSAHPDLVIMEMQMNDHACLEAAKHLQEHRLLPIVFFTDFSRPDLIEQVDSLVATWLALRSFTLCQLQSILTLAWSRFQKLQALTREIVDLKESLRTRKLIDRAKGLLMEREGISEAEAYRRIQRMSRDRNIAMHRIAEAILLADPLRDMMTPCD